MQYDFPNDADGIALRKVLELGADISKPMVIDFQVAMPNESTANTFSKIAIGLGYQVRNYESKECSLPWTCECSILMIATYENLIATQTQLAEIAIPYGGFPDGWGTFGNNASNEPPQ